MKMFSLCLRYTAARRLRGDQTKSRIETGTLQLLVLAANEPNAEEKARRWFKREATSPRAHITFGTGVRDALPRTIKLDDDGVFVRSEDADVVVIR